MADGTDGFSQAVKVMEFLVVAGKGGHILGPRSEDEQRTIGAGFKAAALGFSILPNGVSLYMYQARPLFQGHLFGALLAFRDAWGHQHVAAIVGNHHGHLVSPRHRIVVPKHSSSLATIVHLALEREALGTGSNLGVAIDGGLGILVVQLEHHELGVLLGAGFPCPTLRTVGVAILDEVGPCGQHLLGEIPVALGPRTPAVLQALEDEPEVGGVEGTLQTLGDLRM